MNATASEGTVTDVRPVEVALRFRADEVGRELTSTPVEVDDDLSDQYMDGDPDYDAVVIHHDPQRCRWLRDRAAASDG